MGVELQFGMMLKGLEMDSGVKYTIIYYVYFTTIRKYQQNKMSTQGQNI